MTESQAPTPHEHPTHQTFWLWVMCLTGVDYFSTLGYQPSIAFKFTGLLAPLATVFLVLMTLFGALPVYRYVAGESFRGQGSIGMLAKLLHGWKGKFLVLVLLGFAATDFVITKTLSAADAAEHLIHNPLWRQAPQWLDQMTITMILLVALGLTFLRGFRDVIGIAVVLVVVYLFLNAIVIGCGLWYLAGHNELLYTWHLRLMTGDWHLHDPPVHGAGWLPILGACVLLFPKLALGLSGFETGVTVMPLVKGDPDDDPNRPMGRIRNTRKLLLTAALIMSVYLLGSSTVTSILIEPSALEQGGLAENRALAYLAHGEGPPERVVSPLFGEVFGTIYDFVTVAILWFAGASAMSGLLNLVPQYLPSYGMAPDWARAIRPMVVLFTCVNLFVTYIFRADVEAQGGAYATGVMVLISSACVATMIDLYHKRIGPWVRRVPWTYTLIGAVFLYSTIKIMIDKPDGLQIASFFIVAVVVSSIVSRILRSTELRFTGFEYADEQSRFLWDALKHLEFPILVPHRPGRRPLEDKEEDIRRVHRLASDVPIVYIEASVGDPSEFMQRPLLEVKQAEERFVIRVTRCVSIAHVIAAITLELSKVGKPPELHFGWSDEAPLSANLRFVLFGEGNVPWMVRELTRRAQPDPTRRPRIVIG
ncbi:MAG: hypothetical protein WD468_02935 [Pirellulales bacterium]